MDVLFFIQIYGVIGKIVLCMFNFISAWSSALTNNQREAYICNKNRDCRVNRDASFGAEN